MEHKHGTDTYISDTGIIEDNSTKQARFFVGLCHTLSLLLAILGIIAFIKGNF